MLRPATTYKIGVQSHCGYSLSVSYQSIRKKLTPFPSYAHTVEVMHGKTGGMQSLRSGRTHGDDQMCRNVRTLLKYSDAALFPPPTVVPGILGHRDRAAHSRQGVPASGESLSTGFRHQVTFGNLIFSLHALTCSRAKFEVSNSTIFCFLCN
jgi:hypothetical protein